MRSITFFLCLIPVIAFILLILNLTFAPHSPYQEKSSTFECGFHSFLGQNRTQFSISFFIYALLFLLFDLELLVIYPYVVSSYDNNGYGLTIMLIFFAVLTIGFAFELGKKALNIESRQHKQEVLQYRETLLKSNIILFNSHFICQVKKFLILVYDSVHSYFKQFNFIKLISGILKTRLIILSVIGPLYILDLITTDQCYSVSCYIICALILLSLGYVPLQWRFVIPWFIKLSFNCIIASIFIYITIKTFLPLSILPFVTCLGFDTFSDNIIYINPQGEPSDPGGGGPFEPGGGPSGGGPNGGPSNEPAGKLVTKAEKDKIQNNKRAKNLFVSNWLSDKSHKGIEQKFRENLKIFGKADTNHFRSIHMAISKHFENEVKQEMVNNEVFKKAVEKILLNKVDKVNDNDLKIAADFLTVCVKKVIDEREISSRPADMMKVNSVLN